VPQKGRLGNSDFNDLQLTLPRKMRSIAAEDEILFSLATKDEIF
jgi:hypothetical protein